jgi:hypothetical protein
MRIMIFDWASISNVGLLRGGGESVIEKFNPFYPKYISVICLYDQFTNDIQSCAE